MVSLFQAGSFFGAGLQLPFTEKYGRKWSVIFSNIIFIASAFAQTFANGSVVSPRLSVNLTVVARRQLIPSSTFSLSSARLQLWSFPRRLRRRFLVPGHSRLPRRVLSSLHPRSSRRFLRHLYPSRYPRWILDQLRHRDDHGIQQVPVATPRIRPILPRCVPAHRCLFRTRVTQVVVDGRQA
jgi:hypothetical protein